MEGKGNARIDRPEQQVIVTWICYCFVSVPAGRSAKKQEVKLLRDATSLLC